MIPHDVYPVVGFLSHLNNLPPEVDAELVAAEPMNFLLGEKVPITLIVTKSAF